MVNSGNRQKGKKARLKRDRKVKRALKDLLQRKRGKQVYMNILITRDRIVLCNTDTVLKKNLMHYIFCRQGRI